MTEHPTVPGGNRPVDLPGHYDREVVEHVLRVQYWQDWDDMLSWLRSTGITDPEITPDELRGLRQDAELAKALDLRFRNDTDGMCVTLQQAKQTGTGSR